jgi:hypothetical protein
MTRKWLWFSCIFSVLFFVQLSPFNFRDFLEKGLKKAGKAVAVAAIIRKMAPELNNLINGLLLNNGAAVKQTTKVVPLFSFGDRTAVGGAQVSGAEDQLAKVRAVFQIDGDFQRGKFRVKAFVPTTSSTKLRRVTGVGVSALLDYHVR